MAQMRCLRLIFTRRATSRCEISSPAYSAIFLPFGNSRVAKQPLPSIGDFWTARPGASFIFSNAERRNDELKSSRLQFIVHRCGVHHFLLLFQAEAAGDGVGLVLDALETVARALEVEHVDRPAVGLEVVDAPGHRLAGARVLVAGDYPCEPPGEALLLAAGDEAGQEPQLRVLLAAREVREARAAVNDLLAAAQVAIRAVAVDELHVPV